MFTRVTTVASGCDGKYGGGGILSHSGGGIVVGEELVNESPVLGGGGLRSLRMKGGEAYRRRRG